MAAAGWRDGRSAVIAGDLEGGVERCLLELGLNEHWICDRTAQRESLGLDPWIPMICRLRLMESRYKRKVRHLKERLEVRCVWPGSEQHYRMLLKQLGLERGKQLLIYLAVD